MSVRDKMYERKTVTTFKTRGDITTSNWADISYVVEDVCAEIRVGAPDGGRQFFRAQHIDEVIEALQVIKSELTPSRY